MILKTLLIHSLEYLKDVSGGESRVFVENDRVNDEQWSCHEILLKRLNLK